jgi:hypothetical protein
MKYMLLVYSAENAWTDEERQNCFAESIELTHVLKDRGRFLAASPLQPVLSATSVRVREGKPIITDGPFAETREQLGGYFLVEARDLNEAISIAAQIPGARKGTIEVRPVLELPGLPTVP